MGEGESLGVVPQFARELYDRIEGTTDDQVIVVGACLLEIQFLNIVYRSAFNEYWPLIYSLNP